MNRFPILYALLLFLFLAPLLDAQWQWSNPVPQGNDLWNVSFAPGSGTGWAVGGIGMILKTNDGGASWQIQESGREDFLRGVEAIDAQTAWVVGDNGTVLKTTDGGTSWPPQISGTTAGINVIHALSASIAAFVGDAGMLHTTTNGGATWIPRSTGTTNNLNSVFFTSATDGAAVGSAKTMLRTTNGGANWTPVTLAGMTYDLIGLFFIDAQNGWASGSGGRILRTTNGGQNWQTAATGSTADLNRVIFADTQEGWAVGEGGALLHSSSGGVNWSALNSGTINGIEGLGLSGSTVVAVGIFGDILRSTNGSTFDMITGGVRKSLNAVSAAPPSSAWAVGSDGVVITTNSGGQYWQPQSSGTTEALFAVDNIGGTVVVACGNGGVIIRSSDAGQSWSSVNSGASVALNGIDLLDNGTGFIVGSSGRILKTTNSGSSWFSIASGTLQSLNAVHFTDANHGTAVGASGTIISTTNGGNSWSSQQGWTQNALFSVIRDGDYGMICGDAGEVIFTDDGGASWTSRVLPTTVALFSLTHPAPAEYAAVGEEGVIMRTSDNGLTWVREISHAMYTCYGADAHGGTVYTVGDFGLALRNTTYPYPIELRSFSAARDGECILLRWETEREESHLGTILQHSSLGKWQDGNFFPSQGSDGGRYSWRDCSAGFENVRYRLKSIGLAGDVSYSPEVEVPAVDAIAGLPSGMSIEAWPQPSYGDVQLRLQADAPGAAFAVADALGRIIYRIQLSENTLPEMAVIPAGIFPSSGMYSLLLHGSRSSMIRQIMVLK
ncbi:MAG: YCF48-related protein [Bacteroidota bacterium]